MDEDRLARRIPADGRTEVWQFNVGQLGHQEVCVGLEKLFCLDGPTDVRSVRDPSVAIPELEAEGLEGGVRKRGAEPPLQGLQVGTWTREDFHRPDSERRPGQQRNPVQFESDQVLVEDGRMHPGLEGGDGPCRCMDGEASSALV